MNPVRSESSLVRRREYNRAYYQENRTRIRAEHRESHLVRTKGITGDEFAAMLQAQQGCCACCCTDTPGGRGTWHVDHDHESGRVRGLLCHACNIGIGHLGDNLAGLYAAVRYLEDQ